MTLARLMSVNTNSECDIIPFLEIKVNIDGSGKKNEMSYIIKCYLQLVRLQIIFIFLFMLFLSSAKFSIMNM